MITTKDLKFKNGKAEIKQGRKTIAKIIDRKEFYKINNLPQSYSEKYPYSLEMKFGIAECENLNKCIELINKYI